MKRSRVFFVLKLYEIIVCYSAHYKEELLYCVADTEFILEAEAYVSVISRCSPYGKENNVSPPVLREGSVTNSGT
jgi:hypothetical protein